MPAKTVLWEGFQFPRDGPPRPRTIYSETIGRPRHSALTQSAAHIATVMIHHP